MKRAATQHQHGTSAIWAVCCLMSVAGIGAVSLRPMRVSMTCSKHSAMSSIPAALGCRPSGSSPCREQQSLTSENPYEPATIRPAAIPATRAVSIQQQCVLSAQDACPELFKCNLSSTSHYTANRWQLERLRGIYHIKNLATTNWADEGLPTVDIVQVGIERSQLLHTSIAHVYTSHKQRCIPPRLALLSLLRHAQHNQHAHLAMCLVSGMISRSLP